MRHNRVALLVWVLVGGLAVSPLLEAVVVKHAGTGVPGGLPGLFISCETVLATESGGTSIASLSVLAAGVWLKDNLPSLHRGPRLDGQTAGAGTVAALSTLGGSSFPAVSAGDTLSVGTVGVVAVVALGGIVAALALRSGSSPFGSDALSDSGGGPDESDVDPKGRPQSVDPGTLDRIDRTAPDAVRRVREQQFDEETVEGVETTLYRGIEDAIADGTLDPSVGSKYGEQYEIVNLPGRFREIDLPIVGGRVHVREVETQLRVWIEDDEIPIREVAYAVEAILDHRDDIERHVRNREEEFEELRSDIESDIESIRSVTTGLEGSIGERTRMLVLEDRHGGFDGVGEIESRVSEAKSKLHRCAFGEATGQLRTIRSDTDDLLTAVDFVRSLVGGIEHGQRSARIPNSTTDRLYTELKPLLEQQYDVALSIGDGRVSIETDGSNGRRNRTISTAEKESDPTDADRHARDRVEPGEAADEILYVLRELKRTRTVGETIEYQTEQLPDSVASHGLLEALVVFCRRQTDIVAEVTLQEDAPPGFLELRFTETTESTSGIDELIDRFIDRYGSADQ